jgi:nitrite reductase/ring-hydroxylating ferredoxin subunit
MTWRVVAEFADLPSSGDGFSVEVEEGRFIALFRVGDEVRALDDACPHQGAPLSMGVVKQGEVTCSWHGWHFEVETGANTDGLASCVAAHPARVSSTGQVELRLEPAKMGEEGSRDPNPLPGQE